MLARWLAQASRRASIVTSRPILLPNLKQSAAVLAVPRGNATLTLALSRRVGFAAKRRQVL